MSSSGRRPARKLSQLERSIPKNPRYANVKSRLDTGASKSRAAERRRWLNSHFRRTKDEIFKRISIPTFVQLLLHVAEEEEASLDEAATFQQVVPEGRAEAGVGRRGGGGVGEGSGHGHGHGHGHHRQHRNHHHHHRRHHDQSNPIIGGVVAGRSGTAAHSVAGSAATTRTTVSHGSFLSVITGVGERDEPRPAAGGGVGGDFDTPRQPTSPFLLLDVRDVEAFDRCHINGARHFHHIRLRRSSNTMTREMQYYANREGHIIVLYDEDESLAPAAATMLTQRRIQNVFLLAGGLKLLGKLFPARLVSGPLPASCEVPLAEQMIDARSLGHEELEEENGGGGGFGGGDEGTTTSEPGLTADDLELIRHQLDGVMLADDAMSVASSRTTSRNARSSRPGTKQTSYGGGGGAGTGRR